MARLVGEHVWAAIQEYCGQAQCEIHIQVL